MRSLLLIPLAAALACVRENPAFDAGEGAGTSGSPDVVTTGPAPTTGPVTGAESSVDAGSETTTQAPAPTTTSVLPDTTSTGDTSTGDTSTGQTSTGDTSTGETSTGDTSTGETSTGDTSTGEPPALEVTLCEKLGGTWQLSAPQKLGVPVDSQAGDRKMWLGASGTTLLWASSRDGKQDSYRATRAGFGEPFTGNFANNLDIGLSTAGEDGKVALAKLETRAYVATRPVGAPGYGIYVGDRVDNVYGPTTKLPLSVPDSNDLRDPHISVDDQRLYFTAVVGDDRRVMVAVRPGPDMPFAPPVAAPFTGVDEPDRAESEPTLPAHELALVYTRAGDAGGDSDLWISTRLAGDLPFGPPQPLPGVNSPDHESSPHLSRDGCELFFARASVQDPSLWDIYRSEIQ